MQKVLVASLVSLSVLVFSWQGAAQEAPPAKEKAASPFENPKEVEDAPRTPAKHQIELAEPLAADKTLEERLETKASFHAEEAPLKSFAEALEAALDTSVVLATKKLEEAAINTETPVTYKLKNVRIKTALKVILGDLGLAYVTEDNVLIITTPEDAGSQLTTRVYDCRDLMKLASPIKKVRQPKQMDHRPEIGTAALPAKAPENKEEAGADGGYNVADLIEVITTTVSPDSWDDVGGPGSVQDFKGLVTISQTQEVHDGVEQLLNMLHKAGGLEEKVKVSR
jgi:general secretion pathway protein D